MQSMSTDALEVISYNISNVYKILAQMESVEKPNIS